MKHKKKDKKHKSHKKEKNKREKRDKTENGESSGKTHRKRKCSDSDSSEREVQVKRRKRERQESESPPEVSSGKKTQMSMAPFVGATPSVDRAEPGQPDGTMQVTCDATIEVYKYSHSKKSGSRNTLVVIRGQHHDLHTLKQDLRKEYGVAEDARRHHIGSFNVEIGVACSEKHYMANTQTEWAHLRGRLLGGLGQYGLTVQLHEIKYARHPGISEKGQGPSRTSRGPYKRDERVTKDEDLLKNLRSHSGPVSDFKCERLKEQEQLLKKFKEDVESHYPGSQALSEIHIVCGKCGTTRVVNRLRYHLHFANNHWKSCKVVKSGNIRDIFSRLQGQTADKEIEDESQLDSTSTCGGSESRDDSDGDRFACLEELDPVVVALQRELENGRLPRDHIFYKVLRNSLEFAQKSGDPRKQFTHDKDVTMFVETLAFHGKDRVVNLLRGPGFKGQKQGGKFDFKWEKWNLPFVPSKTTISKDKAGYATKDGIIKSLLVSYLLIAQLEESGVQPLIDQPHLRVIPVSLATDGMSIKPGLQFDTRVKNLVGLLFPVDLDYVKATPSPDPATLKSSFVTEVNSEIITTLDNNLSLPVGLEFTGKRVTGADTSQRILKRVKQLQICLRCLMQSTPTDMSVIATLGECCRSHCEECLQSGTVCQPCSGMGHGNIQSPLTTCQPYLDSGSKCVKLLVLLWAADCEESNKQAMEKMVELSEGEIEEHAQFLRPVPEAVHLAKCFKSAFANWFLYYNGERFNLSNLRVLYNDEDKDVKRQMRKEVTLSVIRNRDRMSVDPMLLIAKPSVREIIRQVPHLVQTVIPETFRLYKGNSKGVLDNPTGICVGDHGSLFITDNQKSRLFLARLHYPVDVTEISKSLGRPNGVSCINGVVFVADTGNERVAYKAVGSSVFIAPKKMKVTELRDEIDERNIQVDDKARRPALVTALTKWVQEQRKGIKYSVSDLNNLPLNKEIKKPLAIVAAATDLLMVSDSHSHSVYQVSITNNGAFLQGTVSLLLKLPETAQPFGLAFDGSNVYVADSSIDGGITKLDLSTSESLMLLKNGTPLCQTVHGVEVSADGNVIFTDRGSRVVRTLSQNSSGMEVGVLAGSGADMSRDGSGLAACFSQPTALCVKGKTIYVADTAVGAIKVVTPTNYLCKFLELLHILCRTFGVHLRGVEAEVHTIEEAVSSLNEISTVFDGWVDEVQEKMGRKATTQGPQGTVSSKSRRSVEILKESLSSLGRFLEEVNPRYSNSLKLAATLTLVVENFFSQMRSRNDMPTALEFAYLFGPTIRESLKQLTDTGFVYYTSSSSHYEPPDEMKLQFRDLPIISFPPSVQMTKEDQKLMRDWRDNFGKPVRQLTVQNQSTKDNVGTLPLFAYTAPDPAPSSLDFSAMTDITGGDTEDTEADRDDGRGRRGVVLFEVNSIVVVKRDHIPGVPSNGPFFVGKVTTDVTDEEHNSYFDVELFVPSFEDCLLFLFHGSVKIHRDAAVGKVDERHVIREDRESNSIKLTEPSYETFLSNEHDIEDLSPERELGEDSEDANEEEYDDETTTGVFFGTVPLRPLRTSSGRNVIRPVRLDL